MHKGSDGSLFCYQTDVSLEVAAAIKGEYYRVKILMEPF